jgi:hypothetical protein
MALIALGQVTRPAATVVGRGGLIHERSSRVCSGGAAGLVVGAGQRPACGVGQEPPEASALRRRPLRGRVALPDRNQLTVNRVVAAVINRRRLAEPLGYERW